MSEAEVPEISEEDAKDIRKGGGAALILGVLMMVLGFIAMGAPAVTGSAAVVFVGAFVLVGGVFELAHAMIGGGERSRVLGFLSGVLSLLCGIYMLARPMHALLALTLFLAIYFVVDGISRVVISFKLKPEAGWVLVLVSGIVTFLLGFMIWRQWPVSGAWAIGLLVGIRIFFSGITMMTLGTTVRAVVPKPSEG